MDRDFIDEKLVAIRRRRGELEAREQELGAVVDGSFDIEAATTQALARMTKIREALEHGSIVEQKGFLGGLIAGITLYPSEHRGVVRFHDLLPASFMCGGGTRSELEKMQIWPRLEEFHPAQEGWRRAA